MSGGDSALSPDDSRVQGQIDVAGCLVPGAMALLTLYAWWVAPPFFEVRLYELLFAILLLISAGAVAFLRLRVRNPRDYYGGLALLGLSLFAMWASGDLPGMHGFAFGPGTAIRLFAGLLGVLGAVVAVIGFLTDGPQLEAYAFRGPIFITASIFVFASCIRPLGLVIASFGSIVVSAAGTHEVRWVETLIWAAVLTLFCCLLFPYGLNLPLQLWPRF
jgi:putative tricarboxylic transport membrane protein